MTLRGIIVLIITAIVLPYCFLDARIGILTWLWFALMNPHQYTWGALKQIPLPQIIALTTIVGAFINGKLTRFPLQREIVFIAILWIIFTLTSFGAIEPDVAWEKWAEVSKILLMVFLSVCIDWDRKWIYYMIVVIAFSIGLIGIKATIFSLQTGGQWKVYGPPGSFLADNTAIAVALNMSLPLFLLIARDPLSSARFKLICYFTFACSVIAALLTYSRGGVIGAAVVGGFLLLRSRYKSLAIPIGILAVAAVLSFFPEQWLGRMQTVQTYEEDGSAISRMTMWKVLWQFSLDHPLTGGGFRLYSRKITDAYLPKALPPEEARRRFGLAASAHSIWFAVLAEHGFIGFFFYILLMLSTFQSLRWIKRVARRHPSVAWMEDYARLLGVSFWAFFVTASFLDFAYFDLYFQLIGLVVILKTCAQKELVLASRKISVSYSSPYAMPTAVGTQRA